MGSPIRFQPLTSYNLKILALLSISAALHGSIAAEPSDAHAFSSTQSSVQTSAASEQCNKENCLDPTLRDELRKDCPNLNEHIFLIGTLPVENSTAGIFPRELREVRTLEECAAKCCNVDTCSYVIMPSSSACQLYFCTKGPELCMPKTDVVESNGPNQVILVRFPGPRSRQGSTTCETGVDNECLTNEACVSSNSRSRNGHCQCDEKYILSPKGSCVPVPDVTSLETPPAEGLSFTTQIVPSKPPTPKVVKFLEVSVGAQNITLPNNEAFLYAYAVPQALKESPYSYEWTLISHPSQDPATLEGQTTETLHLSGLKQGSYMFQVTVKGLDSVGSANASVTVFPEKRINQAPVAVISPPEQNVQLPTNSAVLDATASTDDDRIVSYKWELQKYPIDYAVSSNLPPLNSTTLQVKDLIPGNYTFRLTVEDAEHLTNSTTANVTVIKETDYPPTANAGKDIVMYLPETEVTLNGNSSTDDKKIVQWEWKETGEAKKAVDMQDTHSAYLKLSGLDEGLYQFELTVTDEAGQVSNPSVVHIFVKKPTGNPPKASAGVGQTIALPQTWVSLDASESKGDSKLVKWKWTQLSGPNNATIGQPQEVRANASGLTKGDYMFQVEIEDDAKLTAKATVNVTVMQKTNEPPKANAGEDATVTLPITLVQLNGSGSKDDVKINEWKWERQEDSSAAGIILGNTDSSPNLQLTSLIPGKYIFKLTVKDEQGLSDEDTVTLSVNEDPMKRNLIEVILGIHLSLLTETDKDKFLQQLTLLIHDTKLEFHHVTPQLHSEFAVIVLYGRNEKGEVADGLVLANELRQRLTQDVGLLAFPVLSIDTVLCLDPCSGHGACHDFSNHRECVCDAFWMENYLKKHFGSGERNCDWSKIYVGVITSFLMLMFIGLIWSLVFLFQRNLEMIRGTLNRKIGGGGGLLNGSVRNGGGGSSSKRNHGGSHNHKKQYTLLGDEELEMEMEIKADEPESDDSDDSQESLIFQRGKDSSKGTASLLKGHSTASSSSPSKASSSLSNGKSHAGSNGILKKPRPGVKA